MVRSTPFVAAAALAACLLFPTPVLRAQDYEAPPSSSVDGVFQVTVAANPRAFSGEFYGLLRYGNGDAVGSLRVKLTNGRGSAAVRANGYKPCVVLIGIGGDGHVGIGRIGDPSMSFDLRLIFVVDQPPQLVGIIKNGAQAFPIALTPVAAPVDVAQIAGSYTFLFNNVSESPLASQPVAGAATARVTADGKVRSLGILADGTVLTQGGQVDTQGSWSFFQQGRKAGLAGSVKFFNSGSPLGTAHWEKGTSTADLLVSGSRFTPVIPAATSSTSILTAQGLTNDGTSAQIPGLSSNGATQRLSGSPSATVTTLPTGMVLGRYQAEVAGMQVQRTLAGVALQDYGISAGFVLKGLKTAGQFQVAPSTYGLGVNSALQYNQRPGGQLIVGFPGGTIILNPPIGPVTPPYTGGPVILPPQVILPPFQPPVLTTGDAGAIIKTGAGTLMLGGSSSFALAGTVTGGVLQLNAGNLIPSGATVTLSPGFFSSLSTSATPATLTLPAGVVLAIGGNVPAGWSVLVNGSAVTPSGTIVIPGSGAGATGTVVVQPDAVP